MEQKLITFSFGQNWKSYLQTLSDESIQLALGDIDDWLGRESVVGKTVLDIGCGSGIHSLCFYLLGAMEIVSFDVDPHSVEATRSLWEKSGRPSNWKILPGSILDKDFIKGLGTFEIVYSWGVLHHTGAMWEAIETACSLVMGQGLYWIALYVKGPNYTNHLALKQSYNRASETNKKFIAAREISKVMWRRLMSRQNPFTWNQKKERGMTVYHDLIDWLGGLPYEVAGADEVVEFCERRGFVLEKIHRGYEGGPNIFLFSLPPGTLKSSSTGNQQNGD